MHLLIIHDDKPLLDDFQKIIAQRIETITVRAVHWQPLSLDLDLFHRHIQEQKPDIILFIAVMDAKPAGKMQQGFRDVVGMAAALSADNDIPLIFLSSAAVFKGEQLHYDEFCETAPNTAIGRIYEALEAMVEATSTKAIIVRSSWLYSPLGDNFLTQVIDYASRQKIISVNSAGKGCPTASNDLARVLVAICLQVDLGIDVWGVYHYCSSDTSIGFQFIETLLMQAAKFDERIDAKKILFEHNDTEKKRFFFEPVVLNCQKLLDTFGIHQKPWRSMISDTVKTYYQQKR